MCLAVCGELRTVFVLDFSCLCVSSGERNRSKCFFTLSAALGKDSIAVSASCSGRSLLARLCYFRDLFRIAVRRSLDRYLGSTIFKKPDAFSASKHEGSMSPHSRCW